METPTPLELKKLCDILCDKSCALSEIVDSAQLEEWQFRGCKQALIDLHHKVDVMLEIMSRQPKVQTG